VGAKLVLVHTHDDLREAINSKTGMIYTTALGQRLEKALGIAKQAGVPLMLDDAAGIPPIEDLKLYNRTGVGAVRVQRRQGFVRSPMLRIASRPQAPH
jgi:L-seryl-tRNA(Ser) seleniumtransferase